MQQIAREMFLLMRPPQGEAKYSTAGSSSCTTCTDVRVAGPFLRVRMYPYRMYVYISAYTGYALDITGNMARIDEML